MKIKLTTCLSLVVGLLAVCNPMFAHHGNVAYDESKVVVLKQATVTKVNWANPHILLLVDVKDDSGNVKHWAVEGGSPSAVNSLGWSKDTLQPGDVITVYVHAAKNGNPVGRTDKLMLADGRVLGRGTITSGEGAPATPSKATCDQDFTTGGNEAAACRPDGRKTN